MSRLINTEEFIKRIDHYPPDIRNTAKKELRYCKTVDAIPVRTAKWEHYRNGSQLSCSECGENAPVIERWYCNGEDDFPKHESWGTPYCPFCGSRMVNGET